jgi:hypothetical protein
MLSRNGNNNIFCLGSLSILAVGFSPSGAICHVEKVSLSSTLLGVFIKYGCWIFVLFQFSFVKYTYIFTYDYHVIFPVFRFLI